MIEKEFWLYSPETIRLLKKIDIKRTEIRTQLGSGSLLAHPTNEILARKYAEYVGFVNSLDYIERLINDRTEEDGE